MSTDNFVVSSTIYTAGHSNRSSEELIRLLDDAHIKTLVDVRTHPISRRHPQFCSDTLRTTIEASGIQYHWAGRQLGGMRKPVPGSPHTALKEDGLRGYADYMDSENFKIAATQLIRLAKRAPLAILCAERLPQHCHRSLIADYLTLQGLPVIHLLDPENSLQHQFSAELRRESLAPVYDRLTQENIDLG